MSARAVWLKELCELSANERECLSERRVGETVVVTVTAHDHLVLLLNDRIHVEQAQPFTAMPRVRFKGGHPRARVSRGHCALENLPRPLALGAAPDEC